MAYEIDSFIEWSPDFVNRSPMYAPLRPLVENFSFCKASWPDLSVYQQVLESYSKPILTHSGKPLKVVAQDGKPVGFDEHYAPRIYNTGEIQTRSANWHDFFQYLTWFMFPKTKAAINAIHIPLAKRRINNGEDWGHRSPMENMLSLFDEGGAVIISPDVTLLQLIRDFKWKELFWERREELIKNLSCITFGHAMYEKGLNPYVGMTANAILIEVESDFLTQGLDKQLALLDEQMAASFLDGDEYSCPKDLSPFPILGMPDWDNDNEYEAYYDNADYFRSGRGRKKTSDKGIIK